MKSMKLANVRPGFTLRDDFLTFESEYMEKPAGGGYRTGMWRQGACSRRAGNNGREGGWVRIGP